MQIEQALSSYVESNYDSSADFWMLTKSGQLMYDGRADLFDEDGNMLLSGVDGEIWKSLVKYMGADAVNSMLGGDGSMSLDEMAAGLLGMYNTAGQYSPMAALPTFGVRDELSGLAIGAEAIWDRFDDKFKDTRPGVLAAQKANFLASLPGLMEVSDIATYSRRYWGRTSGDQPYIDEYLTPADYFNDNMVKQEIDGIERWVLKDDVEMWTEFDAIIEKYDTAENPIVLSGPWNVRPIVGWPDYVSFHSFPSAIDINTDGNGQYRFTDSPIVSDGGSLTENEFVNVVQAVTGVNLRDIGYTKNSNWKEIATQMNAASDVFEALAN